MLYTRREAAEMCVAASSRGLTPTTVENVRQLNPTAAPFLAPALAKYPRVSIADLEARETNMPPDFGLWRFRPEQVAAAEARVVLMHTRRRPGEMQKDTVYRSLVPEVIASLGQSLAKAEAAGIASDRIVVDPGIGFGKTAQHNLQLLGALRGFNRDVIQRRKEFGKGF